ncbi:cytochrome P450 [Elysia marginata]|uniref:Cytochrome P450 n=1 Tax=Elysia marginata TaxID=1093978 RepID=A0AAV4GFB5_9GAST|nr:cytochrome P450 [Elysia marginata]
MGEMYDPKTGTTKCIAAWQQRYGRVIPIFCFWDPVLIVTDPAIVREITVKNFNTWADRYLLGHGDMEQQIIKKGVFFAEGASWKRIRRIMTPTFSSTKLKQLTYHINLTSGRLAQKLRDLAVAGRPANAKNCFGAFALDVICGTAFGLDTNSLQNRDVPFMKHAQSLLSFDRYVQMRLTIVGLFPWIGKIFQMFNIGFFKNRDVCFFKENIMALIKDRKENDTGHKVADFLQLLLNAEASDEEDIKEEERKLTTEEITAQGIIFIMAGYETSSSLLQFLSYELARNQEVQEKLAQEIQSALGETEPTYYNVKTLKYMEAVINETLRMYPPVVSLTRQAEVDTVINGRTVPAGTGVLIPVANLGRDPEFFPDPHVFRPERFLEKSKENASPLTFLPFGYGPRACIGLRVAMMEAKIALVHILRIVRVTSATPEHLELEEYTGVLVPKDPIQLNLQVVP